MTLDVRNGLLTPCDQDVPTTDGRVLKAWYWKHPDPRAVLIVVHGLGEHSAAYVHLVEHLLQNLPLDILALDFRGHGRSPGRRGVLQSHDDLVLDLQAALAWADRNRPGLPRYVLGHSNGGLVALKAALRDERNEIAGLILSNPALVIKAPVPTHKRLIGQALLRFAPGVTLRGTLPADWMTRDPLRQHIRAHDRTHHDRISAPLFFGMVADGPELLTKADAIHTPLLLLLGGDDPVIDPLPSQEFFERYGHPEKTLRLYPEMRHEPFNEIGRCQVLQDVCEWLAARLRNEPRSLPDGVPTHYGPTGDSNRSDAD